jgi:hypothetical protein
MEWVESDVSAMCFQDYKRSQVCQDIAAGQYGTLIVIAVLRSHGGVSPLVATFRKGNLSRPVNVTTQSA